MRFKFSRVLKSKQTCMSKLKQKNARKFELLISDQTLEDMLRGNSAFETDIPVQFYLSKGLVLRKIHTLIKFKQEDFASNFIKMTTTLRKNALTNFDKAFWKFVNNVLFGKSMEGKSAKFLA